jgi:pyruvate dehydrogenase E2 component (dihydrolipoamide acetyltransferase)
MANEVKLPRLGQGMEAGTIVKWLKSEGEQVEKGDPLYELDTDKVTQEVEADFSGVLLKITVPEGEASVGTTIAVIGEQGEEVSEETGPAPAHTETADDDGADQSAEKPAEAPAREPERERGREASVNGRDGGRIKASPLARRIARERGIDLAALRGTGPEGRVVAEDVERAEAAPAPAAAPAAVPAEVERVELTSLRRTIARRLTEAWQAPAFQISMTADMTAALATRAQLVELHPDEKPTISDLLTRLAASALMRHREVNALFHDDAIELHPSANVGIAVATDRGLVVPVIRDAQRKTVAEIATDRAGLVERARSGKLQQQDLEGGTFTISNLGMYGVERFIAVLNPPQVSILAVGAVQEQPVVADGDVVVRPRMELTLTSDHRAVDGAVAAEFLATLKRFVETPALAL